MSQVEIIDILVHYAYIQFWRLSDLIIVAVNTGVPAFPGYIYFTSCTTHLAVGVLNR